MTNQLFSQRVSPSGPLLGSPPALVGDGQIDGRCWRAQGSGDPTPIPQVTPVLSPDDLFPVAGLDMVPVDIKAGYGYDIAVDLVADGAVEAGEQSYILSVQLSIDGVSWAPVTSVAVNCFDLLADGRLHTIRSAGILNQPWKFARVVVNNAAPVAEPPTLLLIPDLCSLVIQEFTAA